jgi:single-stranded DNA-binding protein
MLASNLFVGVGKIVSDAEIFRSKSGRTRVSFRVEFPRDPSMPKKVPHNDYATVVYQGDECLGIFDYLLKGQEVLVIGWMQSRDLSDGRVAYEIGAHQVRLVFSPEAIGQFQALTSEALARLSPDDRRHLIEKFGNNGHSEDGGVAVVRAALEYALSYTST